LLFVAALTSSGDVGMYGCPAISIATGHVDPDNFQGAAVGGLESYVCHIALQGGISDFNSLEAVLSRMLLFDADCHSRHPRLPHGFPAGQPRGWGQEAVHHIILLAKGSLQVIAAFLSSLELAFWYNNDIGLVAPYLILQVCNGGGASHHVFL
jgi:hypothetical protein